jgi:DnaJ-domain-containing protein 1
MPDYFALLNEPRRPWLEPEALKTKFLAMAAVAHPDKQQAKNEAEKLAANRRYAELNAAYNCLTEPKLRLSHLLELEQGTKPPDIQQIPNALAELFAEVAATCRNADNFLSKKSPAASPMLQVQQYARAQEQAEPLRTLHARLAGLHGKLIEELKLLDVSWTSRAGDRTDLLNRLEELYRLLGYYNRWNSQIQERIVQLSL